MKPTDEVLEPLSNNVIVRQTEAADKSKGGLYLPEQSKKARQPKEGTVMALGPGKLLENGTRIPMPVGIGDKVIFAHHAGQAIMVDEEELLLMTSEDVLARVRA